MCLSDPILSDDDFGKCGGYAILTFEGLNSEWTAAESKLGPHTNIALGGQLGAGFGHSPCGDLPDIISAVVLITSITKDTTFPSEFAVQRFQGGLALSPIAVKSVVFDVEGGSCGTGDCDPNDPCCKNETCCGSSTQIFSSASDGSGYAAVNGTVFNAGGDLGHFGTSVVTFQTVATSGLSVGSSWSSSTAGTPFKLNGGTETGTSTDGCVTVGDPCHCPHPAAGGQIANIGDHTWEFLAPCDPCKPNCPSCADSSYASAHQHECMCCNLDSHKCNNDPAYYNANKQACDCCNVDCTCCALDELRCQSDPDYYTLHKHDCDNCGTGDYKKAHPTCKNCCCSGAWVRRPDDKWGCYCVKSWNGSEWKPAVSLESFNPAKTPCGCAPGDTKPRPDPTPSP